MLYSGLRRQKALNVLASDFRYNPRMEVEPVESPKYLGMYVGEENGELCPKLQAVSQLLDHPFDGLSVHRLPQLPSIGDFCVGVITGPSGSGKTTLARELFG